MRKFGDGKGIIEILNIGFEPLLLEDEYKTYSQYKKIRMNVGKLKHIISSIEKIITDIDLCLKNDIRWVYVKNNKKYFNGYHINDNSNFSYNSHQDMILYKNILKDKENNKILSDKLQYCLIESSKKKTRLKALLEKNLNKKRKIYTDRRIYNEDQLRNIAIFESTLTRTFNCVEDSHSDDIISVVTYYTEIFNNIIHNGFYYKGNKYVFFTAGAGQTRNKKSTFVKEEKLNKNVDKLFCGLKPEDINKLGGMNTNKYLAYTSLCQTNSSLWEDFDIDKAIVVDDIEFMLPNRKVRYIYTESLEDRETTNKIKEEIEKISAELSNIKKEKVKGVRRPKNEIDYEKQLKQKKEELKEELIKIISKYHTKKITNMDVNIPFTDGFGINFKDKESAMVRLPYIKGLVSYINKNDFKKYCKYYGLKINKITDIYGKQHSINNIDYIFTKSQFKMYKYFNNIYDIDTETGEVKVDKKNNPIILKTGWEVYKEKFKEFNCEACKCNIEDEVKLNAKTNYQVLQTLTTEMTDEDIIEIGDYDIQNINGIGDMTKTPKENIQFALNLLGADKEKSNRLSYFQKSLLVYPEMIKDYYVTELLKKAKDSMIKKMRSGKFNINGAYTFIIPDPFACLQWWFLGERDINKLGVLRDEETVSCSLFDNNEVVDCLRSPHLDHAHCLRKNLVNKKTKRWFKTKGIYISPKDIMCKLLMFDNDGDKALVHNNKVIKRNAYSFQEKYEMIPNYYDMPKANAEMINSDTLFKGIVTAYHHGNIGTPSNEITKIWSKLGLNSSKEEILEAIEIVALKCADVNFTIDFAKCLFKPEIPKNITEKYKVYSKNKLPNFFMYAKNKKQHQVEQVGEGNIDRIQNVVKNNRLNFNNILKTNETGGYKYDYRNLLSNKDAKVDINSKKAIEVIDLYYELHNVNINKLNKVDVDILEIDDRKKVQMELEYNSRKQRKMFSELVDLSEIEVVDILVKALKDKYDKDTLWKVFGEVLYKNLLNNLNGTKICDVCGKRFEYNKFNPKQSLCLKCYKEKRNAEVAKNMKKMRQKNSD